jgi:hypothetical protein
MGKHDTVSSVQKEIRKRRLLDHSDGVQAKKPAFSRSTF